MKGRDTLAERLKERIRRDGPVTFREWMRVALYDEREGYYCRRDLSRWGRTGDYRTLPERTPLYSATFARHFAQLFEELGSPEKFSIIEAGAGGGHFAHSVLRTLERDAPSVFSSVQYLIEELSEDSRARAANLLEGFGDFVRICDSEDSYESTEAGIIFSNELLDAFPVNRVVMRGGELREFFVGLDEPDEFSFVEMEPSTSLLAETLKQCGAFLSEGQIAEVNLDAAEWIERAAERLGRGYVITVDYGAEARELFEAPHRHSGTLRTFEAHSIDGGLLENPGRRDITSTVNWTQIINAGERAGLETVSLERLDKFLLRAGLVEQLERETSIAETEAEKAQLSLGTRELILPGGMSEHFQVLIQRKRAASLCLT